MSKSIFLLCLFCEYIWYTIAADNNWWQKTTIYQIYPRSFKDSNGDGIGDLNGIIEKLDYIKSIGIETIWISPIYPSPQVDFGYDISNFTDINPEYGTLADFQKLVTKAKSLGLKVLMDFVPNHSSPQHEWFKKSVEKIKPYDEYYVWKDAKIVNGTRQPPNNWLCSFGGSAWEWNSQRGQYYFHQFAVGQADLNYRSPDLRREMENVLLFWVNRGVSGFRVDAINTLFEDARFLDEPKSGKPVPPDDTDYLLHIYTIDQNETYDVVQTWRNVLDNHSKTNNISQHVMLTEAYTTIPLTMKYYTSGSSLPMNFYFITELNNASSAIQIKNTIHKWLNNVPDGHTPNWVTGNHDNHRVATRMGPYRADQLTFLAMMLPGVPIFYNGDEIGMIDKWLSYKETLDPAGCGAGPERYYLKSRDPERTPFQWDNSTSAGFSTSNKTWLPVHENYHTLNMLAQKNSRENSFYRSFVALTKLRKISPVLKHGITEVMLVTENVLSIVRRLKGFSPIVLLTNCANKTVTIDASSWLNVPSIMRLYGSSVNSGMENLVVYDLTKLTLYNGTSVVFGNGYCDTC